MENGCAKMEIIKKKGRRTQFPTGEKVAVAKGSEKE